MTVLLCYYDSGGIRIKMRVLADRQRMVKRVVVSRAFYNQPNLVRKDIKEQLRRDLTDKKFDARYFEFCLNYNLPLTIEEDFEEITY